MKTSNLQKKYSHQDINLTRFYEPVNKMNKTQNLYQFQKGNKQGQTFRRKKLSTCHELNYSSCLNPFSRSNFVRFDQKPTYQQKKNVPFASNAPTDPVTLRFQIPQKKIRVRPQFSTSMQYQCQVEKKFLLPSERQMSPVKKRYYPLMSQSYSSEKQIRIRTTQPSYNIKSILQYSEADHAEQFVTPKVGKKL